MNFNEVTRLLSNNTNREILRLIIESEKQVFDIYNELKSIVKYRESVYKALEKMKRAGLLQKSFKNGNAYYKCNFKEISVKFLEEEIKTN